MGDGSMTDERTVWCSGPDCPCWLQRQGSRSEVGRQARGHGWRRARGRGWTCPGCLDGTGHDDCAGVVRPAQ